MKLRFALAFLASSLPWLCLGENDVNASDRAKFDDIVAKWKAENPGISKTLTNDDFNRAWDHISGAVKVSYDASGHIAPIGSSPTPPTPKFDASSNEDIKKARGIVSSSIDAVSEYNRDNTVIHRNNYNLKPHQERKSRAAVPEALLDSKVTDAAALVAEADAHARLANGTLHRQYQIPNFNAGNVTSYSTVQHPSRLTKRGSGYWLAELGAQFPGNFPYGGSDNKNYKVFRNVMDYGAKGDGVSDDSWAIIFAMYAGNRCAEGCASSTVKGAIVYFPPGTYLISRPIDMLYNTQFIGDPKNLPVLRAASSFTGLGVLSSDVYYEGGNGSTWYLNTANFLRQVRNFVIDAQDVQIADLKVLHWQVAQATSLYNVHIRMRPGSSHIGLFIENGSGGVLDSLSITGGAIGINCGNQQFTSKNIFIGDTGVGISMLWDWGWTWQAMTISNTNIGIQFKTADFIGGSLVILDSVFLSTGTGISIDQPTDSVSMTIKNVNYFGVQKMIESKASGAVMDGGSGLIDTWILGTAYDAPEYKAAKMNGGSTRAATVKSHPSLLQSGRYYTRSKPQYENLAVGDFLHMGFVGKPEEMGNGDYDATGALSFMLELSKLYKKPVFIPTGSYIVTDTIHMPPGAKIVGACWSQIVATGPKFADMNNPKVMLRIGYDGEFGSVEISDMLFTVRGPTAGAVLVEWNLAAAEQGGAAMWDSHFRVGGAKGSNLQAADCPKLTGAVNPKCIASSLLLHLTKSSSSYLDNVWAWVADHDLDDPTSKSEVQIDIYSARGILIESRSPTWLYGTSSEHSVLYQYMLSSATSVLMGMIQTESPYFLPNPPAPKPFESAVGKFASDPTFSDCTDDNCRVSWALYSKDSKGIFVVGAGLYSWFYNKYDRSCVASQSCQQRLVFIDEATDIVIYSLYTVGVKEMVSQGSRPPVLAKDNLKIAQDPYVSIIATYNKRPGILPGGVFEEIGPKDIDQGSCDDTNKGTGYLALLDWFFRERYNSSASASWETQFFYLAFNVPGVDCSSIKSSDCKVPATCDKTSREVNHANKYWAYKILENYWNQLRGAETMIRTVISSVSISIAADIAKDFPAKENKPIDPVTKAIQSITKAIGLGDWLMDSIQNDKDKAMAKGFMGKFNNVYKFIADAIKQANPKEDDLDIQAIITQALKIYSDVALTATGMQSVDFFYRGSNITSWPKSSFPKNQPYSHPVPNFLADGRFSFPMTGIEDTNYLKYIKKNLYSALVSIALKAENYYVLVDAYHQGDCNSKKTPSAQFIDGHCYALHKPGDGWNKADVTDPRTYSRGIDAEKFKRLTEDYLVDLRTLYLSSANCQSSSNEYYHDSSNDDFNAALLGGVKATENSCFYSYPVIYAELPASSVSMSTPCRMVNGTSGRAGLDYLPPQLRKVFGTKSFCKEDCVGKDCNTGCPGGICSLLPPKNDTEGLEPSA